MGLGYKGSQSTPHLPAKLRSAFEQVALIKHKLANTAKHVVCSQVNEDKTNLEEPEQQPTTYCRCQPPDPQLPTHQHSNHHPDPQTRIHHLDATIRELTAQNNDLHTIAEHSYQRIDYLESRRREAAQTMAQERWLVNKEKAQAARRIRLLEAEIERHLDTIAGLEEADEFMCEAVDGWRAMAEEVFRVARHEIQMRDPGLYEEMDEAFGMEDAPPPYVLRDGGV